MFRQRTEDRIQSLTRPALRSMVVDLVSLLTPEVAAAATGAGLGGAAGVMQLELGPVQLDVVSGRLCTVIRALLGWSLLSTADDLSTRPTTPVLEGLKDAWKRSLELAVAGSMYRQEEALVLLADAMRDAVLLRRVCSGGAVESVAGTLAPAVLDALAQVHAQARAVALTEPQFQRSLDTLSHAAGDNGTRAVWKAMARRDGYAAMALALLESAAAWSANCQGAFIAGAAIWDEQEFGRAIAVAAFHQHREAEVCETVIRVLLDKGRAVDAAAWLEDAQRAFPGEPVWDVLADRLA
jgi:hypothetical protein